MFRRLTVLCLALSCTMASIAAAAPAISISRAWSRPALPGMSTGVIYLTITNAGSTADRLLGASTPVATSAGLHESMTMQGMSQMTPVKRGLAVPAGASVSLAPGGYHLMLMGLKRGLAPGGRFPATLNFARAGRVAVNVEVRQTAP